MQNPAPTSGDRVSATNGRWAGFRAGSAKAQREQLHAFFLE